MPRSSTSDATAPEPEPHQSADLSEFFSLLDRVPSAEVARKLHLDLARDAAMEVFRKLQGQIEHKQHRIERLKQKRQTLHQRHLDLLCDLATGSVTFPLATASTTSPPPSIDELHQTLIRLREEQFLEMARVLRAATKLADTSSFRCVLVEKILVEGSCIMAEHFVRHSRQAPTAEQDEEFLDEFRHHIAGNVNQALGRLISYQVTPDVGLRLAEVLQTVSRFLFDLLRTTPAARLIMPLRAAPFEPDLHVRLSGRATRARRVVRTLLYPGLIVYETPGSPRIVEKAQVHTERVRKEKEAEVETEDVNEE